MTCHRCKDNHPSHKVVIARRANDTKDTVFTSPAWDFVSQLSVVEFSSGNFSEAAVFRHQEEPPVKVIELHAILFALHGLKETNNDSAYNGRTIIIFMTRWRP